MASELIEQLQMCLRKEAGIRDDYDSKEDEQQVDVDVDVDAGIGRLDPSCPPYLRCSQCGGRLLRGIQSIVCIYCGAPTNNNKCTPDHPIPFNSTFAYRCFLQSLHLTGSEAVEASDSNKGNPSKDAITLSHLLNIELKCPVDSGQNRADEPNPTKSPLNLAGVDLDNFFSEPEQTSVPSASEQQLLLDNPVKFTEPHASPGQSSFALFENTRPTQTFAVDDSSGWEAEFQSAGVRTAPVNSTELPFSDASQIVLSSPLEKAFESEAEIKLKFDGMDINVNQTDVLAPQASISDSWTENDQWHGSNIVSSTNTLQPEMKIKADQDKHLTDDLNNLFPTNNNLFQDDLWLSSTVKHTEDESFDAWQDFTSSGNASDPFPSSSNPTLETSTNKLSPGKSLASLSNDVQDEFDSLLAPDLFPGTTNGHNGLTSVNDVQEGSYPDRLVEMISDLKSTENTNRNVDNTAAGNTAETLMAQMNDLSFMLEDDLSVPEKQKENGVDFKL